MLGLGVRFAVPSNPRDASSFAPGCGRSEFDRLGFLVVNGQIQSNVKQAQAPPASRAELLDDLHNLRHCYFAYHNEKETLAWAGLAAYLAVTVALGFKVGGSAPIWGRVGVTSAVSLGLVGVLFYARMQFNLREWAARINGALGLAILQQFGQQTPRGRARARGFDGLLADLLQLLGKRVDKNKSAMHPTVFAHLDEADADVRVIRLEAAAYSLVVLAGTAAIVATWLS
jgi:hypothetical protein